ncbi:hypothetical protein SEA_SPARCETUS_83 [Microbacterium phage Sparcetus]|nr:hypothetical protein SEA_SPARCETUS_83 [Microbacterium phage Sparcetus]
MSINPAVKAIEQAIYSVNERLEDGASKLNHLSQEVMKAKRVYDDAIVGRDRQQRLQEELRAEKGQLMSAKLIVERAIASNPEQEG